MQQKNEFTCAIVIPCYKEANRINITKYEQEITSSSLKIIFVDDGSPDNTFDILKQIEKIEPKKVSVIKCTENQGKAEAIRYGMNYALDNFKELTHVGFLDADLAVKISEAQNFLDIFAKNSEFSTVIGVRSRLAGHHIERSKLQYILQKIIAKMGNVLFQPEVIDTQCGAKIFKADTLKKVIKEKFITKWLFDQELLTRIFKLPENKDKNWLFEYPVISWTEIGNSHRKTGDYLVCLHEYFKLLRRYGIKEIK